MGVQGSGFRVQGSGFRFQGSGFRVQGSGFRVQGSGCRVQGSGFRVQGPGFRAPYTKQRATKGFATHVVPKIRHLIRRNSPMSLRYYLP